MADNNILDRINTSGKRLGVTKTEIAQELNRLTAQRDAAGMQALFSAYSQWEMKQSAGEDPSVQHTRCLDNFYVAAQIGDCIKLAGGDLLQGFIMYEDNPDLIGETVQFFRDNFQYTPPPPVVGSDQGTV